MFSVFFLYHLHHFCCRNFLKALILCARFFGFFFRDSFEFCLAGFAIRTTGREDEAMLTKNDDDELSRCAARLGANLLARGLRLTAAESCTGGWIAKALTDASGSSGWFDLGLVTYSNEAKRRLLGVAPETLEVEGAVSEATVLEMVRGALVVSGADLALAVSGIAGPSGGLPGKPVGTVWIAWARKGRAPRARRFHFDGDRDAVRRQTVAAALDGVETLLD